jgi:hypothetical protein
MVQQLFFYYYIYNLIMKMRATYLGSTIKMFRKAWTGVPHLQTRASSKLSHVPGHARASLGLGMIGCAPKGPTQAS